jgi:hypothetical protein
MRQIDIIAIVGKTHDASAALQSQARAHGAMQDHIAVRQAAKADRASEQVSATAEDDRLELSTEEYAGNGGGGGDTHLQDDEEETDEELDDRTVPSDHCIDFLA